QLTQATGESKLPSLAKEGWTRHQVNGPVPLTGADGVVRSTSNNRWLERTTPSAPAKEASPLFLNGRSHPSFAKEYSELSCWPAPKHTRNCALENKGLTGAVPWEGNSLQTLHFGNNHMRILPRALFLRP